MQHLRMTAHPPLGVVPRTLRVLVGSEHVSSAEWVSWNLADTRGITLLLHVVGDLSAVRDRLDGAPEVVTADFAAVDDRAFYLLTTLDPGASPVMEAVYAAVRTDGVVLLPPRTGSDDAVDVRVVGEAAAVTDVVETLPADITVDVREVGERAPVHAASGARLSPRQRRAVRVALDLGYYEHPRQATHADVAEALACAPSTASEHLQKAEAKLIRSAMRPA